MIAAASPAEGIQPQQVQLAIIYRGGQGLADGGETFHPQAVEGFEHAALVWFRQPGPCQQTPGIELAATLVEAV